MVSLAENRLTVHLMAQFFSIHAHNPQTRLIRQAAGILNDGGVIVYPTDSCYALGCLLSNRDGELRIRRIRDVDDSHHFTLMCRDLSEISLYAKIDNVQFRLLKATPTPGDYTFILPATREVPRRTMHPKKKTIGLRVPQHPVAHALLQELNAPLLSSTLILPGDELPLTDAEDIRERLERAVDLVMDSGSCGFEPTTVIDLSGATPHVLRRGKGPVELFETAA